MTAPGRNYFLGIIALFLTLVAGCGGGGSSSSGALSISTSSLPSGNVGIPYGTAVMAAGGTAPYTWTLTSGSLPTGLSLNSGGGINGVPTAPGKSNITLEVMDSATPAATASVSLSLVIGDIGITTTSLPSGSVGAMYSATITVAGGTAPYTWSVSSGSLPPSLSLGTSTGATNTITGTPTVGGVSTFAIEVTDSESPTVSATANFTISISPLALLNNSLPNGLQGTPYSFALDAAGGEPPYTWAVSAGALPGGLNLDPDAGTISGTPTGPITSNFTIQVKDSESVTEVVTESLSLTIESSSASACAGAPTGNESLLNGNYALLVQGFQGGGSGTAVAIGASFGANAAGQVTGGDIDVSSAAGSTHYSIAPYSTSSPVSAYTVGLDSTSAGNLGCVMLTTSVGTTMTFRFSLGGVSGGVATKGKIVEFDDVSGAGTIASGIMALQDTSSFSTSKLSPSYAFGLDGETLSGSPLAEGGSFSVNSSGAVSNEFADVNVAGANSGQLSGGSGNVTGISSTDGRGTASISVGSTTFSWAVYVVNASESYLVSTTAPAGGRALATSRLFTGGSYIFYSTGIGVTTCNGTPCADVNLGLLSLTSGAMNGPLWDYNTSAGESLNQISGGTYSVAPPSGRVTFTGLGSNGWVSYLVSPAVDGISAISVGTDAGAHFGFATLQTGTSVPAEKVIYGTVDPRYNTVTAYAGTAGITGAGVFTGTEDDSGQASNLQPGTAVTRTVSLIDGTGTAGSTGGNNIAVTDGTRLFWFDYGNGAPPVITIAEPQ